MIKEIVDLLTDRPFEKGVFCLLSTCETSTQWRWLPEKLNLLDVATAIGALGSFFAVIAAAVAIFQSAKARNLATVIELTRQLSSEREKAHAAKIYDWSDAQFHAFQMVHLVEQASMIVNQGWVSGKKSREFLLDWLRGEIPSMANQEAYKAMFEGVSGNQLCELFKLRDQFAAEHERAEKKAEAERKQEAHFENIYRRHKARKRQQSSTK
ncbi:hypothetical protein KX729_04310 [Rhizobium sp. XQZ8]|uniref:hypothetical protein n=1 Tax=Rhizobium populisoli TaxID=2859785 RepID=UPI001CA499AB|nr:hypothetical protein [Rhizobium populisoli]MBW6420656.1 hypothetical protein [Rhizobium populisoli]